MATERAVNGEPVGQGPVRNRRKHECPTPVRLYHSGTGRRLVVPCGSRRCSWCGPNIWRPRVLAGLHAGLRAAPPAEYLAILLTAPGDANAASFNEGAARSWHRFMEYLRREYPGARLEFWKVAELQERGHVHFHVVLRGLRWIAMGRLRKAALSAGFGPWVGVRQPKRYAGGARSLGWYFGKYLLKEYQRSSVGVTKLVTFSNGWRAGWRRYTEGSVKGRWIYAGPMGAGWRLVGREVEPLREVKAKEFVPWWGRRSWQACRAAEAETVGAWEGPSLLARAGAARWEG